jgi:Tol biopolymer transport system component/predicted Ser/Thr protein kinase
MAIPPGRRLGPYEILSAIGAGGMGEVYRARDTRLDRTVAIKVLPDHFADRANLRERFEREAKAIASLNHPHICTLYDTGHQDDIDFLVMEYIEGETLAQRLAKGALAIQQVLQYAIEIADALDKAHRKGITHRDLKPGNIMLTKSGTKLLDFGLAKLAQESAPIASESRLPTMKDAITAQGTILGTLQYMAPEQVEGKEADARTDIFAFGVVVYEMATGKKAFEGKSQASLMAKILETDPPPLTTLVPMAPLALDRVVKRCLAKDPDDRWQTARDICEELRWISESSVQTGLGAPATNRKKTNGAFAWALAGVAILMIGFAAGIFYHRQPASELGAFRFAVSLPEKGSFPVSATPDFLSVSPDGSTLAFVTLREGRLELWLRDLGSGNARVLRGTDDVEAPFWSPDGRFIAFTEGASLKKISVSGGGAETIASLPARGGGTWNRDGVILFSRGAGSTIYSVSSAGGSPAPLTSLGAPTQLGQLWPQFLPDGRHFVYLANNAENAAIYAGSLDSKGSKMLLKTNSAALYSPPGYLLFVRAGALLGQRFDAKRLELTGEAAPIAESVEFSTAGGKAAAAVSENGVLAYRSVPTNAQFKLVWVDRKGVEQPLAAPPHTYRNPRLSPDGQRVAVTIDEMGSQEWLLDIARGTLSRLTFDGNYNGGTTWTPDGKEIAFGSDRAGPRNLFWELADGSGSAERLTTAVGSTQVASSWSPDGQALAFEQASQDTGFDIWVFRLSDRKVQPFLQTRANEIAPRFSLDGHWLAYASDESGRYEVYVQPYPGPGGKWQISTEGGTEPVWARNGELFYRNGNKMMVVETTTHPNFSAGNPKLLFEEHYASYQSLPDYDVTADGQRFLFTKAGEEGRQEINVVVNWPEELKQKIQPESKQ